MRRALAMGVTVLVAIASVQDAALARGREARARADRAPATPPPVSLALGHPWDGKLSHGVRLAREGDGYLVPQTWETRGLRFGTLELIAAIQRIAARIATRKPGNLLYIADLSYRDGGPSAWHRSHENGLDADLMFYALDDQGEPAPPPTNMRRFDDKLRAGPYRFDLERNWLLVRSFLEDSRVHIANIFVNKRVEAALLAYARAHHAPRSLVARAAEVMQQSGGAHDDHFHVRIVGLAGPRLEVAEARPRQRLRHRQKAPRSALRAHAAKLVRL